MNCNVHLKYQLINGTKLQIHAFFKAYMIMPKKTHIFLHQRWSSIPSVYKISLPSKFRVASGPGISGNLEKSGNFVALEKNQGISWNLEKSGNLMGNWEKSENFTCGEWISKKFFHDLFKWWTRISHACSYIMHDHGFLFKNKNEF